MDAYSILKGGEYTCVLTDGKSVYTSKARGVKPLLEFLNSGNDFSCFDAADKVVGKGAAVLYVLLKVKSVHALVMSKSAKDVLAENGISVKCDISVQAIRNRKGDGFCPIETALADVDDIQTALCVIKETLKKLQ